MSLSSKVFLLSADDTLHALSNAAFMRMLRRESIARIPEFAGQRVRLASAVVEVANGAPTRIVRCTSAILDIDEHGVLNVERWNAHNSPVWVTRSHLRDQTEGACLKSSMPPVVSSLAADPGSQIKHCCIA